ncbi:MAG: hypothetical protein GXO43_01685 [Crenarchaeota archaeon]|nr:hypothetical protein [Thermoproteota archaeon]
MSEMRVGGSVRLKGPITFDRIGIGGSLHVDGDLTVNEELDVGGKVRIRGRLKARRVDIGGSLTVDGEVEIEELDVGGSARLEGGYIRVLDLAGTLKTGTLRVEKASLAGKIEGTIIGKEVVIEKKTRVKGKIVAERLIVKKDSEIEHAVAVEAKIDRDVDIDMLECVRCVVGKKSWIGRLRYVEEYKAQDAEIDKIEKIEQLETNI